MYKLDFFKLLKEKNFICYKKGRYNLDHTLFEPYDDDKTVFDSNKVWETGNQSSELIRVYPEMETSVFKYFLDGTRMTYKIGDMETTDKRFLPIIAGQLAAGIGRREGKLIRKESVLRRNLIMLNDNINSEDLEEIRRKVTSYKINEINLELDTYSFKKTKDNRPENIAIAKIQSMMMKMEIKLLESMVKTGKLRPESMLIKDGSLQYTDKRLDERLFLNVIGISKSFNPNKKGMLRKKQHDIGTILSKLEYGHRTPVYKYPMEKNETKIIGAWYLRIRDKSHVRDPLEGVIKVEKLAVTESEKEDGFETYLINNISQSIILERNVTCYGSDPRWANHLYPVYLTEKMIKSSFLSDSYFLNIF